MKKVLIAVLLLAPSLTLAAPFDAEYFVATSSTATSTFGGNVEVDGAFRWGLGAGLLSIVDGLIGTSSLMYDDNSLPFGVFLYTQNGEVGSAAPYFQLYTGTENVFDGASGAGMTMNGGGQGTPNFGGNFELHGGDGYYAGTGGLMTIKAGGGHITGNGGLVEILGGLGGGASGNGGAITIKSGAPVGSGDSGSIMITTPDVVNGGIAGDITLQSGYGSVGSNVLISGGNGFGEDAPGGSVYLSGGSGMGNGKGGDVVIYSATSETGQNGRIRLLNGNSLATTTIDFGLIDIYPSKTCFNTKNTDGDNISFFFVGTTMVVENNVCN